jgi:pSer/pThr/pTyr-binding forkhead associated (FHA) protein
MARLIIKTEGFGNRVLELSMGVNRVGRDPECEICLDHDTISSLHCELALTDDGVHIRDCNSTNGMFINGEPVKEAWLDAGQELKIGDVELLVESIAVTIAIPKIEHEPPKAPVILENGANACSRHPEIQATFACTFCTETMCNACVRVMRRRGGQPLYLCRLCSHKCERIGSVEPKKKKSFFGMLQDTVRLKFGGRPKD